MTRIFFLLIFSCLISCSSDDNGPSKNYLPIQQGNTWTYDWSNQIGSIVNSGTEQTEMDGTTLVNGQSFTNWFDVTQLFGFTDTILVNKNGGLTMYKIPEINLGFNQQLSLDPFIVIDDASIAGTILGESTIEQSIDAIAVDTDGITGTITPLINFIATSTHASTFETVNLNGDSYEDVYKNESTFEVEISISANLMFQGVPVNLTHLWVPQQEYAFLENWYANQIGLARSEMTISRIEPDNTVDVPLIGEIDLRDFGVNFEDFIAVDEGNSVVELVDWSVE